MHLHIHWLMLLTLAPLAGWVAAALGLVLGTKVAPQQVSYLFALVVLPLTFLGCIYYPWRALEAVRWLQIVVLINPLVYMCEGFRAALTDGHAAHEPVGRLRRRWSLFAVVLTWIGIDGFERKTSYAAPTARSTAERTGSPGRAGGARRRRRRGWRRAG